MVESKSRITGDEVRYLDFEGLKRLGYAGLDISSFVATGRYDLMGVNLISPEGVYLGLESSDPGLLWTPASTFLPKFETFFRGVTDGSRVDMRLAFLHYYLESKRYCLANASWPDPTHVYGDLYQETEF